MSLYIGKPRPIPDSLDGKEKFLIDSPTRNSFGMYLSDRSLSSMNLFKNIGKKNKKSRIKRRNITLLDIICSGKVGICSF